MYRSGDLLTPTDHAGPLCRLTEDVFGYYCVPIHGVRKGCPALLISVVPERTYCWFAIHDGVFGIIDSNHWERVRS